MDSQWRATIERNLMISNDSAIASLLSNLNAGINRGPLLDPKTYEDFTVKVGRETGPQGVLGGVLSQEDYDTFMDIVKDLNVKDASIREMSTMARRLREAGLETPLGVTVISDGPVEFNSAGKQINHDVKYNQLEYQRQNLPNYTDSPATRHMAIGAMKLVAAIANASPVTGETVSSQVFAQQDLGRVAEKGDNQGVHLEFSELAKQLSGREDEKFELPEELKLAMLLQELEDAAKARRLGGDGDAEGS
ncbi:hypothetical protein [Vreelandella hamiltonii]|uniref:Uncharacterized protein n=2 Tax=Halomonadaceae TaxID=28256 RepID=A0A8H9IBZ2_9GAMM|nr:MULTISPECIES: hypothetical protein [Halomonas]GGW42789.1 hypothetical protein GCM10007157_36030 [Halomonas hamiltonii]GGW71727.1 hypothetical protein GCM10007158_35090 [Halomonas johnsoniae]